MTTLQARATRIAWVWCLLYTAALPDESRGRRRDEIRDHLWESEHAGHAPSAVLRASLAGAPDDVTWAIRVGLRRTARWLTTPTPYLALAAILVVQAAFYWGNRTGQAAHVGTGISELAAVCCLLGAGVTYLLRRGR